MPQYFSDLNTYKTELEKLGAQDVKFNTDDSEKGKQTTTISWTTMDGENLEMDIIKYTFPELKQMHPKSCMAACLTMQAFRFWDNSMALGTSTLFRNIISGMSMRESMEKALMDSQAPESYQIGLRGSDAIDLFASSCSKYSCTDESHPIYYGNGNYPDSRFEEITYLEMSKNNNTVLFTFQNDDYSYSHTMNVSMAVGFSINGKNCKEHDLLLWDTDFNGNNVGGIKNFNDQAEKFNFKFGIIPIK